MKRQWSVEELVEQFTLLPDEMALLETKAGVNQLGFAIWLKFFQHEARFPHTRQEIPKAIAQGFPHICLDCYVIKCNVMFNYVSIFENFAPSAC